MALTAELASSFARTALANVAREYPAKLDHVLRGPADVRSPRELHPAFYGSFDWHSCVHMHWMLARVRRLHPSLPAAGGHRRRVRRAFHRAQHRRGVRVPRAARVRRVRAHVRLGVAARARARARAASAGRVRAGAAGRRVRRALPRLPAAPALSAAAGPASEQRVRARVRARLCATRRATPACARHASTRRMRWFARRPRRAGGVGAVGHRLPVAGADGSGPDAARARRTAISRVARRVPARAARALAPVAVDDRSDGYIVHLDGLNLSRAWCMRGIARALPARRSARRRAARVRGATIWTPGMRGLASGEYVGAHWLATFATLALTA